VATTAWNSTLAQWQHLLATIHGVDTSRRVAAVASTSAQPFGHNRCGGLEPRCRRQRQRARKKSGTHTGPNPVDRAKKGCKRHIITDSQGVPLLVHCTPANVRDDTPFIKMLDSMPSVKMPGRRRTRQKPDTVMGDAGYGFLHIIRQVVERCIKPMLAPRKQRGRKEPVVHGSGLGKLRYVVERTIAWLADYRRIGFCYERTGAAWQAFNELACCIICANRLRRLEDSKLAA
jgi:transposase